MKFQPNLRLLFLLVTCSLSISSFAGPKSHTLELKVRDASTQEPLEGVEVALRFDYGEEQLFKTNETGNLLITWEGKIKRISILAEATIGNYNVEHGFLFKEDLKKEFITYELKMRKKGDYAVLFAEFHKMDEERLAKLASSHSDTTIFDDDENCPKFIDACYLEGASEMQRWINMNLRYPQEAIENNEQGRVYLSFIVEADGTITNGKVERGASDALDYEAMRVLYNMPKWKAGNCDGTEVRVRCRLPIIFTLE